MKWIKLFENNTEIGRNLAKNLIRDLEIDSIKEDINECINELIDNSNSKMSYKTSEELVYLKYKRKNRNYTTYLSLGYYLTADALNKSDINYFNNFIELSNLSNKSEFISIIELNANFKDFELIKNDLKSFMSRVSNIGYDIKILSKYGVNMKRSDIDRYQKLEDALQKGYYFRRPASHSEFEATLQVRFEISADIDISKLKTEVDKSPLPDRLINRYDEFIQKWRIPTEGQKELISWFSDK